MLGHEDEGADIGLEGGGPNADQSEMGGWKAKPVELSGGLNIQNEGKHFGSLPR